MAIKLTALFAATLSVSLLTTDTLARSEANSASAVPVPGRYIVIIDQPSLVERMTAPDLALKLQSQASVLRDSAGRLELNSDVARDELSDLNLQFEQFRNTMNAALGRDIEPDLRYRMGLNGFAVELTAREANRLATMDGVRSVRRDEMLKLQTDAGPGWIGAERVWQGAGNLTANRGAGVVVGIIDSGINWNHPSFNDPGEAGSGHNHVNPYPAQLGLCSDPAVLCNDKLVGVYDFVQDIPSTEFVENNNNGFDDGDHGAHTAGTAAGNPVTYDISDFPITVNVSGVAPNANIVSYRVCHRENPDEPDAGTCSGSWVLAAIDQAISDGVDVINYSIGSDAFNPWGPSTSRAFLNAVSAGIFIATSAGNSGPGESTVGSPANAPWMTAVGAATHDRLFPSFDRDPGAADRVASFSSRGPALAPVQDILKPNVIAPGVDILAADNQSTNVVIKRGTSMSSPHVAGAAALILADRPGLSPSQVASMLELSATDATATSSGAPADHFDVGAGRIQVDQAIQLGVYLDETANNFLAADPFFGGEPRTLNLASLSDANCRPSCSFTRRIGSFASSSYSTSVSGLPAGVQVTVTPQNFTINAGQTQEITVNVDTGGAPLDQWAFGKITISNPNFPDAVMPLSVLPASPTLPDLLEISTTQSSGFQDFEVAGLPPMAGAVFETGGFQEADTDVFSLVEDPTNRDAFDGGEGVATVLVIVPPDTLLLHADTPASDSNDVDLFVGFDANGNGRADEGETICESTTPQNVEFCDITDPLPGMWWVLVQNWDDGVSGSAGPAQEITLATAVISPASDSTLVATGPGVGEDVETFDLRLAWDNVSAVSDTSSWGALRITPDPSAPLVNEVVVVRLDRTGIAAMSTRPLFSDQQVDFALNSNGTAEALYIDVPPGVTSLDVLADGKTASESNGLRVELVRQPFDSAFANAPGVSFPNGTSPSASDTGAGGQGARVTIDGGVSPGRWFVVVENNAASPASVSLTASLEHSGTPVNVFGGLWQPASRPGINQGFEFTPAGNNLAFLWYTYDLDGSPVWYIASAAQSDNNSWTADLLRFTNNGQSNVARQAGTRVGTVGITMLDDSDAIMSWTLFGISGSDRAEPLSRTCPQSVTPLQSFTGLWYRGADGLGGASIVANRTSQAHIHYLYDDNGLPRWLLAAGAFDDAVLPMSQFSGFCPTCTGNVTSQQVGTIDVSYSNNSTGIWEMDFDFASPVTGGTTRRDGILRLSNTLSCEQ